MMMTMLHSTYTRLNLGGGGGGGLGKDDGAEGRSF